MSLDVWLTVGAERIEPCEHCQGTGMVNQGRETVHDDNITHNLGAMARAVGVYGHLWRPDELGITKAKELIEPLREGLSRLRENPEHYKKHNPENGWGSYEGLVNFVERYLCACEDYPEAEIGVSR